MDFSIVLSSLCVEREVHPTRGLTPPARLIFEGNSMNTISQACSCTAPLTRRDALRLAACGFGQVALFGLLGEESRCASSTNPLAPKQSHFSPRAKRVI